MFFGGGNKSKSKSVSADKAIILHYRYAHVMFVFTSTFGYHYQLATHSKDGWHYKATTKNDIIHSFGEQALPTLSLWRRISLPAFFVVTLAGIIIASLI